MYSEIQEEVIALELMFQEYELTGLERVLTQSFPGEQTIDVIIPDSYPDVDRILDAFGTLVVEEHRHLPGGMSLSGTVQGGVLFMGEDGDLHKLSVRVPFSVKKEWNEETENGILSYRCRLQSVDARTVNSRKLLIRVGFHWGFELYRPCGWKVKYFQEPSERLQLRQVEYPLRIPTATGEKTFTMNEELELPGTYPAIATVLKACSQVQIVDQKAVGNKGVFKMEVLLHVLYEDPQGKLCTYDWRIPLSQYGDLNSETQDGELQTTVHMTEFDLEPDSQVESHRLFLRIGFHCRSLAYETRSVKLIEDAYCTDGILEPQWQQWQCRPLLDSQTLHGTARWTGEEAMGTAVDLWAWPEEGQLRWQGDHVDIKIPVVCSMLFYDEEGNLRSKQARSAMETEIPLGETGECVLRDVMCTEVYSNMSSGTPEIRIPVQFYADSFGNQCLRSLRGGELLPLPASAERKPSAILRRTEGEEELWDIAKSYRTPVKAIQDANDLGDGPIPRGTMLLIPL